MDNLDLDREEAVVKEKLTRVALKGSVINNWIKHPAYAIYEEILNEAIIDKKNTWLNGEDTKAKEARLEARGIKKALDVLQALKRNGEMAKIKLNEMQEDLGA